MKLPIVNDDKDSDGIRRDGIRRDKRSDRRRTGVQPQIFKLPALPTPCEICKMLSGNSALCTPLC